MAAVIKVLPQLRASVNEWRTLRSAIALSTSMCTYKERKSKQTNKKWPIDRSTASTCCPPPPSSPSPTFSTDWCRSETSYDVTVGSVLPDNTPTPPGLPLPRQQGELLCPGGMCAMTHRLLSPTQDTHAVVHTHTHTLTYFKRHTQLLSAWAPQWHCASLGIQCSAWTKGTGAACRMWGRTDGDVARGNWYPNTALTPVTPGLLNQWQYWYTWREWDNRGGEVRRTEKDSVHGFV